MIEHDYEDAFTNDPPPRPPKTGMRWLAHLDGEDGNAWVIMGVVRKAIIKTLGREEAERYGKRARAGDYANLLRVSREYVDIQDVKVGFLFDIDGEDEDDEESTSDD